MCTLVFLFAQFFALMPLENVTSKTPANVKFKWKSFRAIFTVFYICYACFTSIVFYKVIFGVGVNAKNIGKPNVILV